jgi:adenine-specific DNA-methyltransferase
MPIEKITADSPEARSADIVQENLDRLRELFPEAFQEGGINFDVLRQLLGDEVDDGEEKFGLNWHGKKRARKLALTPSTGTLRPVPEDSVDWDTTQNLLIEGDNLEVLKLLQKSYAGKVKLIYIDPPYNTGKDFVYPDNFHDNIQNYLELTGQVEDGRKVSSNTEASGRFHTDWLNMMYPRLRLARNLLERSGVVFVSIDDREVGQLRLLLDEIFGGENYLGTIVWRTATDNNPTQIATDHEYVVAYGRDSGVLSGWSRPSEKASLILAEYRRLKAKHGDDVGRIQQALRAWIRGTVDGGDRDLDGVSHYSYVDAQGVYYPGNPANTKPGGYDLEILHPDTGEPCAKPANGFRWPMSTFREAEKAGDVHWGDDHTSIPKIKKRLETATELLKSSYYEDNRTSTAELATMMGDKVFDNPKSVKLLQRITGFTTGDSDLIMDFFAGSGTTAEAVWRVNAQDGGRRRVILVQLPEPLDTTIAGQKRAAAFCDRVGTPRNIAELTKERLRRTRTRLVEDGLEIADGGFRVFKLDSSNIRPWDSTPEDLEQTLLDHEEHIRSDRSEEDVLYETLLKLGLDLCVPMETREISGRAVYSIGGGVLFACLAPRMNDTKAEAVATAIGEWRRELAPAGDSTAVFRDSAFESDVAKANLVAILEQAGISKVRSL